MTTTDHADATDAPDAPVSMDTLVSLCKRRGFVFPASEIYGGFGSTYDYGPLGVELKRNIKDAWWRSMVRERSDIVGIDTAIIQSPRVWKPAVTSRTSAIRWSTAANVRAASALITSKATPARPAGRPAPSPRRANST